MLFLHSMLSDNFADLAQDDLFALQRDSDGAQSQYQYQGLDDLAMDSAVDSLLVSPTSMHAPQSPPQPQYYQQWLEGSTSSPQPTTKKHEFRTPVMPSGCATGVQ